MADTASAADRPEAAANLRAAAAELDRTRERVEDIGASRLEALREAAGELHTLLDRYEDTATGSGNFQAFTRFQGAVASLIEDLDDDLPERETFEAIDDSLQQRRLSESDFDAARRRLEPVDDLVQRLADFEAAKEDYADARRRARNRRDELDDRIAHLEDLQRLGDADLDAPVERLRDPIERYNDAVREAFDQARHDLPARDLLAVVERADAFPLVEFQSPPSDLLAYVRSNEAGTEPVVTLLEYADYSASKLDHYVEDTAALKRAVATRQTYLERLDAGPVTVDWPPPAADALPWLAREYRAVVSGFADEDVVAALRTVRDLAREEAYERLRESARARHRLSASERDRLASGAVAEDLSQARADREAVAEALQEHERR